MLPEGKGDTSTGQAAGEDGAGCSCWITPHLSSSALLRSTAPYGVTAFCTLPLAADTKGAFCGGVLGTLEAAAEGPACDRWREPAVP